MTMEVNEVGKVFIEGAIPPLLPSCRASVHFGRDTFPDPCNDHGTCDVRSNRPHLCKAAVKRFERTEQQ